MTESNCKSCDLPTTILKVCWLSVLLGLGMELLLLGVAAGFGKMPVLKPVLADLVQKISWSSFVCVGVSLGLAASRSRPAVMGLAGLAAAPMAFHVARVLHKSTTQALAIAGPAVLPPAPLVLAAIKAVQYGVFGWMLGRLSRRDTAGLGAYVGAGAAVGAVFSALITGMTVTQSSAPGPPAGLISRGVNELIFPIGCALVLFGAQRLGRRS